MSKEQMPSGVFLVFVCVGVFASVRMCVCSAFQSKSHAGLCICGDKSSHSWRRITHAFSLSVNVRKSVSVCHAFCY